MVWDTRPHPNWLDAGCLKRRSKIESWSNFRDPKVWPSNSPLSFWSCKLSCRCWEGWQLVYLLNLARNPSLTFPPTLCLRPLLSDLFFQPNWTRPGAETQRAVNTNWTKSVKLWTHDAQLQTFGGLLHKRLKICVHLFHASHTFWLLWLGHNINFGQVNNLTSSRPLWMCQLWIKMTW